MNVGDRIKVIHGEHRDVTGELIRLLPPDKTAGDNPPTGLPMWEVKLDNIENTVTLFEGQLSVIK